MAGQVPEKNVSWRSPGPKFPRLSGLPVQPAKSKRILEKLGFSVEGTGDTVNMAGASWHADIEGKADLVEEVIRDRRSRPRRAARAARLEAAVAKPILTMIQGNAPAGKA